MPDNDKQELLEEFSQSLNELVQFKDYFRDSKKVAQLTNWLHEETGVSKIVAKLAVKHVAPFVVARISDLGKTASTAWTRKLNDRLSSYTWYTNLCKRILDTLKTHTDSAFDSVLRAPNQESLNVLINNDARWGNLNPEHQGLVQLLLGQHELSSAQQEIGQQFEKIIAVFSFQLNLISPEDSERDTRKATLGGALWFTYKRRQAKLIGRQSELRQLTEFYHTDKTFKWWCISGAGGCGKSRLALDSLIELEHFWDVGFLPIQKLKVPDALSKWKPTLPTIIVVDYASEYVNEIKEWIDHFIQHEKSYDFDVRLLILERVYKGLSWWENLTQGSANALVRKQALMRPEPLKLTELDKKHQQLLLTHFLTELGNKDQLPDANDAFWSTLHTLSGEGRPLFIGMVALAMVENGIDQLRDWNNGDLLNEVLMHEKEAWERQLKQFDARQKTKVLNLFALSTIARGLSFEREEESIIQVLISCGVCEDVEEITTLWRAVIELGGCVDGQLQPDLLAEYFLIMHWGFQKNIPSQPIKDKLFAAYKLKPQDTLAFIKRCATDFNTNASAFEWWVSLLQKEGESTRLVNTGFEIASQLILQGCFEVTLKTWITVLVNSKTLETKGRALNTKSKIFIRIGDASGAHDLLKQSLAIATELNDKMAIGTILNNIGTNYYQCGDFNEALANLKLSLVIRQEIGDRLGEGVTLNSLGLIYLIRGAYNDALTQFNRSLRIRREIGDKSGECNTLNNISQIMIERGDYSSALTIMQQTLKSFRDFGDKALESATLNNISEIFRVQGKYDKAVTMLEQSLAISQEIGLQSIVVSGLLNIAGIYKEQGKTEIAMQKMEKALGVSREIGDKLNESIALFNIGILEFEIGEFDLAELFFNQSLAISREIHHYSGLCSTLINWGKANMQNGNSQQAFILWLEAYNIALEHKINDALDNLSEIADSLGLEAGFDGWQKIL